MITLTSRNCLTAKDRKRINKQFHIMTTNRLFDDIPLEDIFNILKNEGIVPIMEDQAEWCGILCGESEDVCFVLADRTRPETASWGEVAIYNHVIKNAELRLCWYKFNSTGRYEIVTYIS